MHDKTKNQNERKKEEIIQWFVKKVIAHHCIYYLHI